MPSSKTEFTMKHSDVEKIKNAISRCTKSGEQVMNDYLHNVAGENLIKSMTEFIPRSPRKNVIHAKNSNWSEQENFNLAVAISNSLQGHRGTSFYYLYYVVTGTGTNTEKGERDFMEQGLDEEYNNIVNEIIEILNKNIEKELDK